MAVLSGGSEVLDVHAKQPVLVGIPVRVRRAEAWKFEPGHQALGLVGMLVPRLTLDNS